MLLYRVLHPLGVIAQGGRIQRFSTVQRVMLLNQVEGVEQVGPNNAQLARTRRCEQRSGRPTTVPCPTGSTKRSSARRASRRLPAATTYSFPPLVSRPLTGGSETAGTPVSAPKIATGESMLRRATGQGLLRARRGRVRSSHRPTPSRSSRSSPLPPWAFPAFLLESGNLTYMYGLIEAVAGGWSASVPQPTLAQLGAAIRNLRESRELSIEALAAEADLHTVSVTRIEGGKQNPTWMALAGLATALDVELVDLVRLATEQRTRHAISRRAKPDLRSVQGAQSTSSPR
jgi:DNA-binding XRE family transcriptional regulator